MIIAVPGQLEITLSFDGYDRIHIVQAREDDDPENTPSIDILSTNVAALIAALQAAKVEQELAFRRSSKATG